LVNNAGIAPLGSIEEMPPSRFDELHAVNVRGVYLCCRAVWPVMKRQGGGTILNISSVASADPFPGFTAYGATKAWINGWTRGLADEGKAHGIRVFAVAPGAVETRMLRDALPDFPPEHALDPREVAAFLHTLTQPACRYASGQTIFFRK
ncbi:MAG: SDR family oxidoreductase, partial [Planctomycetota bacterium]